jgi:hypothetical protein
MMRLAVFFVSLSCFGAPGPFSVQERTGRTTSNYPVQIGRPFVDDEIARYPQVGICADKTCAAVTSWLPTQADVKQRYASRFVKHAILSFHIPELAANSTIHFTVRDQAECNCGNGLTKAEMLDGAYDFDAVMALANGVSATISARSILSDWDEQIGGVTGPVYYWTTGSIATNVIIADHRNLGVCNGHACSANDVGSDANKSLRPEFHVTFWPLTRQVKVRFVGGIVNTEAMQNQSYDLLLRVGNNSSATVYAQSGVTTAAGARWTVRHNNQADQTWMVSTPSGNISIEKEIWIGGAPPAVAIDHNLSYLVSTPFFPRYDTTKVVQEANVTFNGRVAGLASSWSSFVAADRRINGNGWWWGTKAMGDIEGTPLPRWTVMHLYSADIRAQEMDYRVTDLGAAFRIHLLEGKAGNRMLRSDTAGSGTGVGRVLSITDRRYFRSGNWTYAGTQGRPQDNVTPVGTAANVAGWVANEIEHFPDRGSAEFVLTGDFFYLQEQLYSASWAMSYTTGSAITQSNGRGPTGAEGGVSDSDPRGMAWAVRAAVMAAYITPDDWPEKRYFAQLINDFVAIEEGARCTASDLLPWCASSPRRGSAEWIWGYTYRRSTNGGGLGYPPLGQWAAGSRHFVQGDPNGGGYGIHLVAGAGTASNSGSSTSITLSDSSACAMLSVGTTAYFCSNASYSNGNAANITAKACPTVTLNSPVNASGCSYWMYSPNVASANNQFGLHYMLYSWGRAVEMGYPLTNLFNVLAGYHAGLLTTVGVNPRLAFSGRTPTVDATTGQYFSSFPALAQGWHPAWQSFSSSYRPGGGVSNGPPNGYAAKLQAAASFLPASSATNAAAAWRWVAEHVSGDSAYTNDPTWALLPRNRGASGIRGRGIRGKDAADH